MSQIVNYMFEQIINFEEPHNYFAKKNDESLWYYIGTFVTKILDTMTNGDSELDNDIEKKFELYNRAILLSQPGHVLDRIGYDVSNPNGDGGFDNDMFSATMTTVDMPKINFDYTPYYTMRTTACASTCRSSRSARWCCASSWALRYRVVSTLLTTPTRHASGARGFS